MMRIRVLPIAGAVACSLALTGCQSFTTAMPQAGSAAASPGSSVEEGTPVATTEAPPAEPSQPYVDAVCNGVGVLLSGLQAFSEQLDSQQGSIQDNPELLGQLADLAAGTGQQLSAQADQARQILDAAQPPDFEGGAQFADRTTQALNTTAAAIDQINTNLAALDPSASDYAMSVMGQVIGFALAYLPLINIFVAPDVLQNSSGLSPAEVVAQSPGSAGFYREARDRPACAPFFEGFDPSELDALLGLN